MLAHQVCILILFLFDIICSSRENCQNNQVAHFVSYVLLWKTFHLLNQTPVHWKANGRLNLVLKKIYVENIENNFFQSQNLFVTIQLKNIFYTIFSCTAYCGPHHPFLLMQFCAQNFCHAIFS